MPFVIEGAMKLRAITSEIKGFQAFDYPAGLGAINASNVCYCCVAPFETKPGVEVVDARSSNRAKRLSWPISLSIESKMVISVMISARTSAISMRLLVFGPH